MNSVLDCYLYSTVSHTGQLRSNAPLFQRSKKGGHQERHVLTDVKAIAEGDKDSRNQELILDPALVERPMD